MESEDPLRAEIDRRLERAEAKVADAEVNLATARGELATYRAMLNSYLALHERPSSGVSTSTSEHAEKAPRKRVRYLRAVDASQEPDRVRQPRRGSTGEAVLRLLDQHSATGIAVSELVSELRTRGHMARSNDYVKSADWEVYNLIRQGWPIDRRRGVYRLRLDQCAELGVQIP